MLRVIEVYDLSIYLRCDFGYGKNIPVTLNAVFIGDVGGKISVRLVFWQNFREGVKATSEKIPYPLAIVTSVTFDIFMGGFVPCVKVWLHYMAGFTYTGVGCVFDEGE